MFASPDGNLGEVISVHPNKGSGLPRASTTNSKNYAKLYNNNLSIQPRG